jgi:LacI family xylobiose transport system transcriptional regulator
MSPRAVRREFDVTVQNNDSPRVTLESVAQEATVSLSTVSKVLNGRSDVAAATRARVEALLEGYGYRRRNPEGGDRALIEVVFHELESAWSMEIIRGVGNVARERGMGVVLTESGSRHAPGPEWIAGVIRRRPAGVVLVFSDLAPEHKEQLRSRAVGGLRQLVGWAHRHPSPHRARTYPHCRDHRPGRHDVLAGTA